MAQRSVRKDQREYEHGDTFTFRGVQKLPIQSLAGLLRIPQGDLINRAVFRYAEELDRTGRLPPVVMSAMRKWKASQCDTAKNNVVPLVKPASVHVKVSKKRSAISR